MLCAQSTTTDYTRAKQNFNLSHIYSAHKSSNHKFSKKHKFYAYCQRFLPGEFLPFRSIHLHFFPKPLPSFSCISCGANTRSCVGPQNEISHPDQHYRQLMQVPVLSARGIQIGSKICVIVFLGLCSENVNTILVVV